MKWPFRKSNIDPGWEALERGKKAWKTLPLEFHNGRVHESASAFQHHRKVQEAIGLIQNSIDLASKSNLSPTQARVNEALAHQELGLLCRVVNDFSKARDSYLKSVEILEALGGVTSRERDVLAAYRETLFRLAELDHTAGNKTQAIEGYDKSLQVDRLLGHDDPTGEQMTKKLLDSLK